jgi:anti-sigma factor RsiW
MKETWDKTMQEIAGPCARTADLIAYLYKEATPDQARDFENHMQRCASCNAEMAAFGDVREAIGEWRQQALGAFSSTAFEANAPAALASARETSTQRRSALTALREFFTLSPVWMRAATAAVALVFCTLAVIAVAHFAEQPKVVVVERPNKTDSAQENNNTQIAVESRESKESKDAVNVQPTAPQKVMVASDNTSRTQRQIKRGATNPPLLTYKRKQALPSNNIRSSEELASANDYLPFTAPGDEDKLPSLVDLADEPN